MNVTPTIHFQHKGCNVEARVDTSASNSNVLVVKPVSFQDELGHEIELVRTSDYWVSNGHLMNLYPDTFASISFALEEIES